MNKDKKALMASLINAIETTLSTQERSAKSIRKVVDKSAKKLARRLGKQLKKSPKKHTASSATLRGLHPESDDLAGA